MGDTLHSVEIMVAVRDGDTATIRDGFRRLIDYPHEGKVAAAGPGPLIVALRAVCETLASDPAIMPGGTCDALEAPRGSPYAAGAALAMENSQALALRFKRHFEANVRGAV